MRGMTGKWKHIVHSGVSGVPKYSTTSAGHWLASAIVIVPGNSWSSILRMPAMTSCVPGRFSQLVPSSSAR